VPDFCIPALPTKAACWKGFSDRILHRHYLDLGVLHGQGWLYTWEAHGKTLRGGFKTYCLSFVKYKMIENAQNDHCIDGLSVIWSTCVKRSQFRVLLDSAVT
jgi:hypothetical protein